MSGLRIDVTFPDRAQFIRRVLDDVDHCFHGGRPHNVATIEARSSTNGKRSMSMVNTIQSKGAELRKIAPLLRCPTTGTQIKLSYASDGRLVSCKSVVSDGIGGVDYPIASNQPVLVDFSSSVLDRERVIASGAESLVRRTVSPLRAMLRRWVFGENGKAEPNARIFLSQLRKQSARRPLILIIGGGAIGKGVGELHACTEVDVVAFDIYGSPHTTFIADAHTIPLSNASVDAVWI